MAKRDLLTKIDRNAAAIRAYRPLSEAEVRELDAYYKIGTTYSSNALEGNSLTISETKVLLEDGITVGGKPIRDCYEATGHAKAYDYMLTIARSGELSITEDVICRLHRLFYHGIDPDAAGQYRIGQVFITGTEYVAELPRRKKEMHPVEFAAYAHRRLVDIHPFQDGNGRTARLLMNLILINQGYCIVSIPPVWRHDYITALQQAQRERSPSDEAFVKLIAECELEAQRDYCRMFHIKLPSIQKDGQEL